MKFCYLNFGYHGLRINVDEADDISVTNVSRNAPARMARKGLLVPAETCPGICSYYVSRNASVLHVGVSRTHQLVWFGKNCSFLSRPAPVSAVTMSRGMRQFCMSRKGLLVPSESCLGVCSYGVLRYVSWYGSKRAARSCRDLPWCLQLRCLAEYVSWYGSESAARSCRNLSW